MRLAELKVRNTQTKTKHLILKDYAGAWGGIIAAGWGRRAAMGMNRSLASSPHFVFVDAFGGPGQYLRDSDQDPRVGAEAVFGSPIIGIRALDDLKRSAAETHNLTITTAAIVSEHEPPVYWRLNESIHLAGYGDRVRQTDAFKTLHDGEIAFLHRNFHSIANEVLAYIGTEFTYSLVLLDPCGPMAIPYEMVARFIAGQKRDVILFFPYQRLLQTTGLIGKEDTTSKSLLANYSSMFGDNGKWMDVYQNAKRSRGGMDAGEAVVEYYRTRLQSADSTLTIKNVGLLAPQQDRHLFHLFLMTHDPTGALAMNEVLDRAKLTEQVLRSRHTIAKRIEVDERRGQLTMDIEAPLATQQMGGASPAFHIPEVAQVVYEQFAGRTVEYRVVCRYLANTRLWRKHVDAAMRHLKKEKRVAFDSLSIKAVLKFAPMQA